MISKPILKATYRDVYVPLDSLLDEDGPRVEVDGYLGEYVEDHGEDGQVHRDPSTSEPLHHVLREGPYLSFALVRPFKIKFCHLAGNENWNEDKTKELEENESLRKKSVKVRR